MRRVTLYLIGTVRYRRAIVEELIEKGEWEEIRFINSPKEIGSGGIVVAEERLSIPFSYLPTEIDKIPIEKRVPLYIFADRDIHYLKRVFNDQVEFFKNEGGFWEAWVPTFPTKYQQKLLFHWEKRIIIGDLVQFIIHRYPPRQIAFAESCTGGQLSALLTAVPGSSKIFSGGMVTYANFIKEKWLGVDQETLERFGAVSSETVKEMLEGILERSNADYGVAISGIAGPEGGTPLKPVGTVYIGVGDRYKEKIERFHFEGGRNYVQFQAVMTALRMLIELVGIYGSIEEGE